MSARDRAASSFRALIVDYNGVLTSSVMESMEFFAHTLGIEMSALVSAALGAYSGEEDNLVTDFETGRISEEDFSERFAARLSDASGREVPSAGLIEAMFGALRLESAIVDAVRTLHRNGIKTALLSNSWGTGGYPRDLFAEIFDVVVISAEVGLRKPDPAIFELASGRVGVTPVESVFVDDYVGHLTSARELGFHTVLHRAPEQTVSELADLFGIELPGPQDVQGIARGGN